MNRRKMNQVVKVRPFLLVVKIRPFLLQILKAEFSRKT